MDLWKYNLQGNVLISNTGKNKDVVISCGGLLDGEKIIEACYQIKSSSNNWEEVSSL